MRPTTCFQGLTSLLGEYAFTLRLGRARVKSRLAAVTLVACLATGCATAVLTGAGQGGRQLDGRTYEEAREDNWLTGRVNRALINDPLVRGMDIDVSTYDGVVTLGGSVASRAQAARAEALAAATPGVRAVQNRLRINE